MLTYTFHAPHLLIYNWDASSQPGHRPLEGGLPYCMAGVGWRLSSHIFGSVELAKTMLYMLWMLVDADIEAWCWRARERTFHGLLGPRVMACIVCMVFDKDLDMLWNMKWVEMAKAWKQLWTNAVASDCPDVIMFMFNSYIRSEFSAGIPSHWDTAYWYISLSGFNVFILLPSRILMTNAGSWRFSLNTPYFQNSFGSCDTLAPLIPRYGGPKTGTWQGQTTNRASRQQLLRRWSCNLTKKITWNTAHIFATYFIFS